MHEPVLRNEVIRLLEPQTGEAFLDLTAGYGGHSQSVLDITENFQDAVLVDRDSMAIEHLNDRFQGKGVKILKQNFKDACDQLLSDGRTFDLILADIGVSSPHLNLASRGFSFQHDGPLDMRMDQSAPVTAADIVNNGSVDEISVILRDYGEERQSRRIAEAIVARRPFTRTQELARTLESVIGWRTKGHHPATRTFQALRIAVNDELGQLKAMLPKALQLLRPGGRFGVITFHSLEDRIVKHIFNEATAGGYDRSYQLLTKKPISPTRTETVNNPRSRSAKLRGVAKIKTERTD